MTFGLGTTTPVKMFYLLYDAKKIMFGLLAAVVIAYRSLNYFEIISQGRCTRDIDECPWFGVDVSPSCFRRLSKIIRKCKLMFVPAKYFSPPVISKFKFSVLLSS